MCHELLAFTAETVTNAFIRSIFRYLGIAQTSVWSLKNVQKGYTKLDFTEYYHLDLNKKRTGKVIKINKDSMKLHCRTYIRHENRVCKAWCIKVLMQSKYIFRVNILIHSCSRHVHMFGFIVFLKQEPF